MMFPKPVKVKKKSKVEIWNEIRDKEISPQFYKWGITSCEIRFAEECIPTYFLGYAHTKKRRDIHTPEDLRRVVLSCQPCHHIVEYFCKERTGKTMTDFLDGIIKEREDKLRANRLL